jgi:hypothetical protein
MRARISKPTLINAAGMMKNDLYLALIANAGPISTSVTHLTPRRHCEERSDEAIS